MVLQPGARRLPAPPAVASWVSVACDGFPICLLNAACGVKYCSEECRDAHSVTGHKLLCPKSEDGLACAATLDELLSVESDSALFLPLAIKRGRRHRRGGGRRQHVSRRSSVCLNADELLGSCTKGGVWLAAAGLTGVDGHYAEELDGDGVDGLEEEAAAEEAVEEEEEESEEDEEGEEGEEGEEDEEDEEGEEEERSGLELEESEAEVALLLPSAWALLLQCFAARLPDTPTAHHVHSLLSVRGPEWLASLVATMERNAVPAIAPSPLRAFLEASLCLTDQQQAERLSHVVEPLVAALRTERALAAGEGQSVKRPRRREQGGGKMSAETVSARLREMIREEGGEPLTPPLEGMAFVASAAALNHSCMPSCVLQFHAAAASSPPAASAAASSAAASSAAASSAAAFCSRLLCSRWWRQLVESREPWRRKSRWRWRWRWRWRGQWRWRR